MIIHIAPNDSRAYYIRGVAKSKLGHYEAAIPDYDKAISLDPDSILSYCNRGLAKRLLGNHEVGNADIQKALRMAKEAGNEEFIGKISEVM